MKTKNQRDMQKFWSDQAAKKAKPTAGKTGTQATGRTQTGKPASVRPQKQGNRGA
jgi:hypothetical protein